MSGWTREKEQELDHHREYHKKICLLLESIKEKGYLDSRGMAIPTEPETDLINIIMASGTTYGQDSTVAKEHNYNRSGLESGWTREVEQLLDHHREYHNKMWLLLESIKEKGHLDSRGMAIPTEPEIDLRSLLEWIA